MNDDLSFNGMNVVLTAGGTGGHIFPAEAVAIALKQHGATVSIVSDARFAKYGGHLNDFETHILPSSALSGNVFKKAKGVLSLLRGYKKARALLKEKQPDVVIGFGGYPSLTTMLAATHLGCKTLIHEQNSVLGKTNRMLAKKVTAIATSFDEVKYLTPSMQQKTTFTGNPVRAPICALAEEAYIPPSKDDIMNVLVIGGSQGASVFSDVVPKAIKLLPKKCQKNIHISQQCRPAETEATAEAYINMHVDADIHTFFTDMPARLKAAHIVVARAGASTVTELAVAGRPSVLIPYPYATDDHQNINAHMLEKAGAAWVMEQNVFTPQALADLFETCLNNPENLQKASAAAKNVAKPHAVDALLKQISYITRA